MPDSIIGNKRYPLVVVFHSSFCRPLSWPILCIGPWRWIPVVFMHLVFPWVARQPTTRLSLVRTFLLRKFAFRAFRLRNMPPEYGASRFGSFMAIKMRKILLQAIKRFIVSYAAINVHGTFLGAPRRPAFDLCTDLPGRYTAPVAFSQHK